jgi:16S rRNA (cytidine1402-2'-O)-methyltransferase
MQDGLNIALVTDAGTPGISDPGEELVRQCHEAGIKVTSLPGACACITALTISGLPTRRFCFEAFLPTDKKERKAVFGQLKTETRTIILYEAPHRLKKTLKEIFNELGNRNVTLCRELTKRHEDYKKMTLEELIQYYEEEEVRGECVLVIEGVSFQQLEKEEQEVWEHISIEEHMEQYLEQGLSKKEAMKKVAKDRGVGKREIYQALI